VNGHIIAYEPLVENIYGEEHVSLKKIKTFSRKTDIRREIGDVFLKASPCCWFCTIKDTIHMKTDAV